MGPAAVVAAPSEDLAEFVEVGVVVGAGLGFEILPAEEEADAVEAELFEGGDVVADFLGGPLDPHFDAAGSGPVVGADGDDAFLAVVEIALGVEVKGHG